MFTGIINNLGQVRDKTKDRLIVGVKPAFIAKLQIGESVAVDGICLTIVDLEKDCFAVDFIPETEKKTAIRYLSIGKLVNLELPSTPTTFLSGHIVQGHVDAAAKLCSITKSKNSTVLNFSIPRSLSRYIVKKGSIAVNGISLTVIKAKKGNFYVGIIPYTLENTLLHEIKIGDFVNIEVDILAKYLEKLVQK